jgi:hypothetical protein
LYPKEEAWQLTSKSIYNLDPNCFTAQLGYIKDEAKYANATYSATQEGQVKCRNASIS